MRIGIELGKIANGGGERILIMLAKTFAQMGHDVVAFTWQKEWEGVQLGDNIKIIVLNQVPRWGNGLRSYREYLQAARRECPACLISFLNTPLRVTLAVGKTIKVPVITSLRIEPVFKTFMQRVVKFLMYRCDGIVFQTEKVKSCFPSHIQRKCAVIQNPVMDDDLPSINADNVKKEIVGIGRLTEQKNFKLLINAFADLPDNDYCVKIYGEGHLHKDLSNQINELGLQNRVFLMGRVERVVDYIKDSDIFVLSSDWEGMPNALIESMAMGLACIATDVDTGGCRELINQDINGILVPKFGKEEITAALYKLITDADFKNSIKKEAVKVRCTHSKEAIVGQWVRYIEDRIRFIQAR